MDTAIQFAGILALLLLVGGAIGLVDRKSFSLRWLLVAAGLLALNLFLLTRGFGALPRLLPAAHWNWQGKILALAATLIVASLPAFAWRRSSLILAQAKASLKVCIPVALLYCLVFVAMAYLFPDRDPASPETMAFQLPCRAGGEPFFRASCCSRWIGVHRAREAAPRRMGLGAVLSCGLFGLVHALGFSHGQFSFDPMIMAITALPSFVAVCALRSGSALIPAAPP